MCLCTSPVIHVDEEQQALCHLAVQNICATELPGLGGDKTDSNAKLNNKIKVRMLIMLLVLNVRPTLMSFALVLARRTGLS